MLEFLDEVVEFKLGDKHHRLNKPTNGQIKAYSKALAGCESDEQRENALIEFLKNLGLEEGVFDKLTPAQAKKLLASLHESEKN